MYSIPKASQNLILLLASVVLASCGGGGGSGSSQNKEASELALTNDTAFIYVERKVSSVEQSLSAARQTKSTENSSLLNLGSPYDFNPGAALVARSSLDVNAIDINVLNQYFGSTDYDVKDINVSADGRSVIFAAHGPRNHPHDFTWNIYEYVFEAKTVRRIISDDAIANAAEDTNPTYALDGSIIFSSNRAAGNPKSPVDNIVDPDQMANCRKVDAGDNASLLHSMTSVGENILQLTYGKNHDLKPTTLKDGRIAFVRWSQTEKVLEGCPVVQSQKTSITTENPVGLNTPQQWSQDKLCSVATLTDKGYVIPVNHYTLLTITADGSDMDQLYKTVTLAGSDEGFIEVDHLVQVENGHLLAVLKHHYNPMAGGDIVELQSPKDIRHQQVFGNIAPDSLVGDVALYPEQHSIDGWFSAVWPYRDGTGRLLVSWSQCATSNGSVNQLCKSTTESGSVEGRYGIWVLDRKKNTRLPVVLARRDVVYSDLAIAQPHVGVNFPFAPYSKHFIDNLDSNRVVCSYPSSDSYSSYNSYSSSSYSSYDSSSSYQASSNSAVVGTYSSANSVNYSSVVANSSAASYMSVSSVASSSMMDSSVESSENIASSVSSGAESSEASSSSEIASSVSSEMVSSVASSSVSSASSASASSEPMNNKPVANAGVDQIGDVDNPLTLDGSKSTDIDGDLLTYTWTLVQAPDFSDAQLVDVNSIHPVFTPDQLGIYVFELVVNDGHVDSDADTVIVDTRNSKPIADAGDDQSVNNGDLVEISGAGSTDADGDILTYSWTILSQPAGSMGQLSSSEALAFLSIDVAGTYVLQLVVHDGIESSEPDTVIVTTKNVQPIAEAGSEQTVILGSNVTLDGTASYDPDGDSISYQWSIISKPSGSTSVLGNSLSENPGFTTDRVGTYVVQLMVSDGVLVSDPDTVTINVEQAVCNVSSDTTRTLPVVIRDFDVSHPDFEKVIAMDLGIVTDTLGADGLPVYAHPGSTTVTTTGEANFNQWYRDVPGVNINIPKTIQMTRDAGSTTWSYINSNFFPIDGMGFGNMPSPAPDHNYHFTLEAHLVFDYVGGEVFTFRGDDDLWVYINGKRAIDIGGIHGVIERSISLDEIASQLGIEKGNTYSFDLFFAERHTVKSNFMFQTNINLECAPK